jgi:Peptidase family M48
MSASRGRARGASHPADPRPGRRPGGGTRAATAGAKTAPVGAPPKPSTEAGDEAGGDRLFRHNRHRALVVAGLVGLIPGVLVGVVLVAVGLPIVAAVALVAVAGGVGWGTWQTAPTRVIRALGAQPSDEDEHPRLHNLVDGLCASMGLPRPTIFVVEHGVPNAMAVGRDPSTACLVVTSALDQSLSLVQLEGVLAHELVHVKRDDIVLAGVAVVAMAPWSVFVGVARAADRVHALVGSGREFSADQQAAAVVRYPPGIGSALEVMVERPVAATPWPPGRGRTAALTRWLWIDPWGGHPVAGQTVGNLDDTRVRAEAQSLL